MIACSESLRSEWSFGQGRRIVIDPIRNADARLPIAGKPQRLLGGLDRRWPGELRPVFDLPRPRENRAGAMGGTRPQTSDPGVAAQFADHGGPWIKASGEIPRRESDDWIERSPVLPENPMVHVATRIGIVRRSADPG
jgi:hypothetical protein